MLIKVTAISYATVGHGSETKVSSVIIQDRWINPTQILSLSVRKNLPKEAPHQQLSEVTIGSGYYTVAETPDQINNLIRESRR
jgi:hypothetical protein